MHYQRTLRLLMTLFVLTNTILVLTCCQQQTETPINIEIIRYNGGSAFLINDNVAVTASHCVKNQEDVLYIDESMDMAIVRVNNLFSTDRITINQIIDTDKVFVDSEYIVRPGESGSPCIKDNQLLGIYVGYNDDGSVVTPITPEQKKLILSYVR